MATGPVMLAATKILRPPPARLGRVFGVNLPRTVPLVSAIAAGIGAVVGMLAGLAVARNLNAVMVGPTIGAALGVAFVTWQPMRGESLARAIGITVRAGWGRSTEYQGEPARMYIGMCPLARTAVGPLRLYASAIQVRPEDYDERGVLHDEPHTPRPAPAIPQDPRGNSRTHQPSPPSPPPDRAVSSFLKSTRGAEGPYEQPDR